MLLVPVRDGHQSCARGWQGHQADRARNAARIGTGQQWRRLKRLFGPKPEPGDGGWMRNR